MTGNQQQWHTRWIIALFVLSAMSMSLIVLFVLYTPSNLVQSRVCLFPLGDSLLSDVCSPDGEGADVLATDEGKLVSGNKTKELGFTLDEEEDIEYTRTLSIASAIYVVSLERRTDRRGRMEALRKGLGLEWEYWDALDKNDTLVEAILRAVERQREDWNTTTNTFDWPSSNTTDSDEKNLFYRVLNKSEAKLITGRLESLSNGMRQGTKGTRRPILCATGNDTIPTYASSSNSSSETNLDIPFHMILSEGMIACWYSHASLMYEIAHRYGSLRMETWDGREGVTVVFEDDVDVEWDLGSRMQKMWTDLPKDWDIVMLGTFSTLPELADSFVDICEEGHCWSNESTNPTLKPTSPLHPSYKPKCTHGYVLSPFGARRILAHLTYPPFAFSRALDQALAHLIVSGRLRAFSVVPSVVVQKRCPAGTNIYECANVSLLVDGGEQLEEEKSVSGDSDIWWSKGVKGSGWRDSLQDSAFDHILRIRNGNHS